MPSEPTATDGTANERAPELLFYDGLCGLCVGFARFAQERDRRGAFRFAPLHGPVFEATLDVEQRAELPDSVVVATGDGRVLVRSAAVVHVLRRLGGAWVPVSGALWLVPRPLRDWGYDQVARLRSRFFGRPSEQVELGDDDQHPPSS